MGGDLEKDGNMDVDVKYGEEEEHDDNWSPPQAPRQLESLSQC